MKNIKIFVELTDSSDLKETEQQLKKISDEVSEQITREKTLNVSEEQLSNVQIYPYVMGNTHDNQGNPNTAYRNLHQIHFPFKVDLRYSFPENNEVFKNFLEEKLSDSPDTIIFVGNFMNSPVPKVDAMSKHNTQVVLIQTTDNNEIDKLLAVNYSINIKDLPNLKVESSDTFTSLKQTLNSDIDVSNNIKNIRKSLTFGEKSARLKKIN